MKKATSEQGTSGGGGGYMATPKARKQRKWIVGIGIFVVLAFLMFAFFG